MVLLYVVCCIISPLYLITGNFFFVSLIWSGEWGGYHRRRHSQWWLLLLGYTRFTCRACQYWLRVSLNSVVTIRIKLCNCVTHLIDRSAENHICFKFHRAKLRLSAKAIHQLLTTTSPSPLRRRKTCLRATKKEISVWKQLFDNIIRAQTMRCS